MEANLVAPKGCIYYWEYCELSCFLSLSLSLSFSISGERTENVNEGKGKRVGEENKLQKANQTVNLCLHETEFDFMTRHKWEKTDNRAP